MYKLLYSVIMQNSKRLLYRYYNIIIYWLEWILFTWKKINSFNVDSKQ